MTGPSSGDPYRVTQARAAFASAEDLDGWARRFDLLSDPNRLRLLLAMHRTPGINVTDLADALQMSGTAVSHALRLLRNHLWVSVRRDGKSMRYYLDDEIVHQLLHRIGGTHAPAPDEDGGKLGGSSTRHPHH